jgi:hypothetical protein
MHFLIVKRKDLGFMGKGGENKQNRRAGDSFGGSFLSVQSRG